MNWRKPLLHGMLRTLKPAALKEWRMLRAVEHSPEQIQRVHRRRLTALLRHAWANTAYYHEVLSETGVVRDGHVRLDRFDRIPLLSKDTIREQGARLRANPLPRAHKPYENRTGGSTGRPMVFWQDSFYWDTNVGSKLYRFDTLGKDLGDPETKIWGADRDIEGWNGLMERMLYHRRLEPCYTLSSERLTEIIDRLNRERPKLIWSYRDGIDRIALYLIKNGLKVHSPAAIMLGGATIYPHIVEDVKAAFDCPVINFYGSREMGDIACQCEQEQGLHIAHPSRKVEILEGGRPAPDGQDGELVVTALTNYAMPLIRYRIGDRAHMSSEPCPCGRALPSLGGVAGRLVDRLVNTAGDSVDPLFFTSLFGRKLGIQEFKRFQVVQEDYARLRIRIELEPDATREAVQPRLDQAIPRIRQHMGPACEVIYEFPSHIGKTANGKQLYIVQKIPEIADGSQTGDAPVDGGALMEAGTGEPT